MTAAFTICNVWTQRDGGKLESEPSIEMDAYQIAESAWRRTGNQPDLIRHAIDSLAVGGEVTITVGPDTLGNPAKIRRIS